MTSVAVRIQTVFSKKKKKKLARFTSVEKDYIDPVPGVIVTTYTMVAFGGNRAAKSADVMKLIQSREWGCLLLDEVHVVPAKMFRKVIGSIACHCKLGLTATLVREDDLIGDLNFLIGPKLYEANWMDLTQSGFLANVSCVEIWCPMTGPFYADAEAETKPTERTMADQLAEDGIIATCAHNAHKTHENFKDINVLDFSKRVGLFDYLLW